MDSLPIVKVDVQAAPTGQAVSQPAAVGDKQATEKKSFSEALTKTKNDTQQKTKSDSNTDSVDNSTSANSVTPEDTPVTDSQEALESSINELNPLVFNSALVSNGQQLPLIDMATDKPLPAVKVALLNQQSAVSQVLRAAVIPEAVKVADSEKMAAVTRLPSVVVPVAALQAGIPPINDTGAVKRGVKSLALSGNENSSLVSINMLKQLQQPLSQKVALDVGVDAGVIDKAIKLLSGNDIARSEVNSAGRTVDSSLNVGLSSDPLKTASENLVRVAQAPKINLPLSDSNWGEEFSNRISWIAKNNIRSAQIKITPAHLGPIEVRVSLQNDQAAVSFTSNHAVVREAIESASARLRESLSEGGFEKVDVDVSSHEERNKQQKMDEDTTALQLLSDNNKDEPSSDNELIELNNSEVDWENNTHQVDYFA
ncbi:hypothetical protein MNBD_GAMMA12-3039 [hydrothermal vent metagenome]|uniref:Flagellar hook-length control protein-like C-terminal domain-containing protein n=1 Tax=hydrothermal vent metagenome TaxID=652676 RepID=A0A3B0XWY9_9ZZZZ